MATHRAVFVASEAILLARDRGSFKLSDLKGRIDSRDETPPADSTIRLILQQLEESGWLERRASQGRTWHASERIDE